MNMQKKQERKQKFCPVKTDCKDSNLQKFAKIYREKNNLFISHENKGPKKITNCWEYNLLSF